MDDQLSYSHRRADAIVDFLECCIHCILQTREVYPASIFERRKKYGAKVWMSRSPDLNDYVSQVMKNTHPLIIKGYIKEIAVCFVQKGGRVVERVVFQLQMEMDQGDTEESEQMLKEQLMAAVVKLQTLSFPSRKGCTFNVVVRTTEISECRSDKWMAADKSSCEVFVGTEAGPRETLLQVNPIKQVQGAGLAIKLNTETCKS
ncbi:unnamed protein product [Chrysoparadoxa australica]